MPVLDQINNLLHSSDPNTQREANKYLTQWQRTIEAWTESHSILNGNFPLEAKFIASQTLRIKILYDFYQLPSDVHLKICESLLSYLNQDGLPRNISSTVALAVCDMAIQMAESWESPVESFINYYKSNRLSLEMVLFLLETLPEETSNNRLILIPEFHTKVTIKLKSEYVKVVEFLSFVRNNLQQLTASLNVSGSTSSRDSNVVSYKMLGRILKVWNNWRRFDTFTTNGEFCRNFLNDCLEIIKNPKLMNEGLEEETYETSVDCMVDLLQECSYLTNKKVYGTSKEDLEYENTSEVSSTRYNDLVELQKACFNILVRDMKPHMAEAFKKRDLFLYNNLSRLFANLVDSVYIDHQTSEAEVPLLMDYMVKFIKLPYLLMYSNTHVCDQLNPYTEEYNNVKSREIVINYLNGLNCNSSLNNTNYTNSTNTEGLDLDEEVCNISQKSVYILVDILSKFSKSMSKTLGEVTDFNALSTAHGFFPYFLSNLLQLLLLVSVPPYQLHLAMSEKEKAERISYCEFMENYNMYLSEVMEVYYELLRVVNKKAVFDFLKANLLNLPDFLGNNLLLQSSFVLLPPTLSIGGGGSNQSPEALSHKTDVLKTIEHLLVVIKYILSKPGYDEQSSPTRLKFDQTLVTTIQINSAKFLGQVKRVFGLDETHEMLKEVLMMLTSNLTVGGLGSGGALSASGVMEELVELQEKLKYESGYSVSLICYYLKMEKLRNKEEVLSILLSSLENVDNELLVMILEGLATSCYNLNKNDLLAVFNQLISNTLNQLTNVIHTSMTNSSVRGPGGIRPEDKVVIMKLLNRIVGFVRNLKNRPELDPIVGERIFPILVNLLKIFYLDNELVEVICRCIKHNARVLDLYFSKYISVLVQTITNVAQIKMFGTYLYLIEWLHSIFYSSGQSNSTQNKLRTGKPEIRDEEEINNLYNLLTSLTLNIFRKSYNNYPSQGMTSQGANNMANYSNETQMSNRNSVDTLSTNSQDLQNDPHENELLIEDFYGLQAEFFLNSGNYLNDLNMVNDIINCSCRFLFIKRPQCIFYFWESLLKVSKYNAQISSLTNRYLQTLVNNCFLILANSCSKSTEHYIENLVTDLISYMRSPQFVPPPELQSHGNHFNSSPSSTPTSHGDKYIEVLFNNGLNQLPMEIIGNDKLKRSFLSGLIHKTTSTVNHLYKLLAKLSMRNRI